MQRKDYNLAVCLVLSRVRHMHGDRAQLNSDSQEEDWQESFEGISG